MTEIARKYLGNTNENRSLARQIDKACQMQQCLEVDLAPSDRAKGRIFTQSTSGVAIGIIKDRDRHLKTGDVFETESGRLILIRLQAQKLMVLSFTQPLGDRAIDLVRLGHVLGNHHYPIFIESDRIYIRLVTQAAAIEKIISEFDLPGLKINYEGRSPEELVFSHHSHQQSR